MSACARTLSNRFPTHVRSASTWYICTECVCVCACKRVFVVRACRLDEAVEGGARRAAELGWAIDSQPAASRLRACIRAKGTREQACSLESACSPIRSVIKYTPTTHTDQQKNGSDGMQWACRKKMVAPYPNGGLIHMERLGIV